MLPDRLQTLFHWISEREAIRLRKEMLERRAAEGVSKLRVSSRELAAWGTPSTPWRLDHLTDDTVLRDYRFCNVQRAHDRVTRWIVEHISVPFAAHEHLWFMLAAARYINWPPTLAWLMEQGSCGGKLNGWPYGNSFEPWMMTSALEQWKRQGNKVETAAYMIRAESDRNAPWYSWSKQRYVAEVVLGKLWEARDGWKAYLAPGMEGYSLQRVWDWFQDPYFTGWGPFMAYQVVVDMRWTRYLRDAPDIQTWAAVGPGSRRGLNRLYGRATDFALSQAQGLQEMIELRGRIANAIDGGDVAPWVSLPDLSDVQNILCETDKYMRVMNGEGRPRAKYVPGRGY